MWSVHHIIATDIFKEDRNEVVDKAWRNTLLQPCLDIIYYLYLYIVFILSLAKMNTFINNNNKFNKKKVVFIMGAIGMGESRLSVELATNFSGKIIN
ncbi:hypothetical protein H5410_021348 [Solanum commersonii]|uniref:Uncharacterized protein n=1 Tax=Solanum commersonii TaxID=4109 RepID=A0A9J5ZAQ8_SOLCO|nr:hypothetical protein H5410_021348 [Solanum commersonii]